MSTQEIAEQYVNEAETFLTNNTGKLKMLLLVRNDLMMGKGKIAAQCAHAAMGIVTKYIMPIHELVMLKPDQIANEWSEDDQIYFQPIFDQDDDEDEDEDEDDDKAIQRAIQESLQLETKPITEIETTAEITETNKETATITTTNLESKRTTGDTNKLQQQPQQDLANIIIDPTKPLSTQLTPRQIREKLYKINTPLFALMKYLIAQWILRGQAKIAVKVNNNDDMATILEQLRDNGIPYYEIYDAGLTQIAANTRTVTAVGPFPANLLDPILGKLKLL